MRYTDVQRDSVYPLGTNHEAASRKDGASRLMHLRITIFATLLCCLAACQRTQHTEAPQEIRISFFEDPAVLTETLELLGAAEVSGSSQQWFNSVVSQNLERFPLLEVPAFPRADHGVYEFASVGDLISALPHPLCETDRPFELNCFDTLIGVLGSQLNAGLNPDAIDELFLIFSPQQDGNTHLVTKPTPREAFAALYLEAYHELSSPLFPPSRKLERLRITSALFRCHMLASTTTENSLRDDVWRRLRTSWRRDGVQFPGRMQVVLCHEIDLSRHLIATAHAGLLLVHNSTYLLIEKAGGRGPFVRTEFSRKGDLLAWLGNTFKDADRLGYTHHFATFGDQSIEPLPVNQPTNRIQR